MNCNVLVVDDSPVLRAAIRKVAKLAGVEEDQIFEAGNGQEALDVLETVWIDLVLLDLNMPVMDGEGLVRALRSDHPNLPILLMSGYTRSEVIGRMVGAGSVEFLAKPFATRQLVSAIQLILSPDPPAQ